ncbi:hypothetical protein KAU04_05075, partial [bacterium]|nr:hypothetical protein [bacterium]
MSKRMFGVLVVALCVLGLSGFALAGNDLQKPGFETWTIPDIPDNWMLNGTGGLDTLVFADQEDGLFHSGLYSVALTCSTKDTRWLEQSTPVTPDSCYRFSIYGWDNDLYGKASVNIRWYYDDSDTSYISGYYGSYTSDL